MSNAYQDWRRDEIQELRNRLAKALRDGRGLRRWLRDEHTRHAAHADRLLTALILAKRRIAELEWTSGGTETTAGRGQV